MSIPFPTNISKKCHYTRSAEKKLTDPTSKKYLHSPRHANPQSSQNARQIISGHRSGMEA